MAQRISRAKARIQSSGSALYMPTLRSGRRAALRAARALSDLQRGLREQRRPEVHRVELSAEAIRLTRMVRAVMPGDAEVTGLLALMLLTDARRPARTGPTVSWSLCRRSAASCGTPTRSAKGSG